MTPCNESTKKAPADVGGVGEEAHPGRRRWVLGESCAVNA